MVSFLTFKFICPYTPAAFSNFPPSETSRWRRPPDPAGRHCGRCGTWLFPYPRLRRCCPPPDGWRIRYTIPPAGVLDEPSPSGRRWWRPTAPFGCRSRGTRRSITRHKPPRSTGGENGRQTPWDPGPPRRSPQIPGPMRPAVRRSFPRRRGRSLRWLHPMPPDVLR